MALALLQKLRQAEVGHLIDKRELLLLDSGPTSKQTRAA
jgi:hypothetical protein